MRAVDTNVDLRLLVRDDPRQASLADAFCAGGAWVSLLVLAETAWVLDAVYERSAEQIATAIEMLLNHRDLTLQDADVVDHALEQCRRRPAIGFSDCLVVEIARKAGHLPLGTFDRDLMPLEKVERLA
jgi:predicted nucleic-acid-binding protein